MNIVNEAYLLSKSHACIVTDDLDRLKENWKKYLGIDFIANFPLEGPCIVRGEDIGICKVKVGFADLGDARLEFIQPVEGGTQEWEFIKRVGTGLHHVDPILTRKATLDMQLQQWEKKGIKPLQVDEKNRWAYMDTQELLGTVIELH
jgi:Glyoxalase/Bleomycin resistance protein/Dioxygenase superfamily